MNRACGVVTSGRAQRRVNVAHAASGIIRVGKQVCFDPVRGLSADEGKKPTRIRPEENQKCMPVFQTRTLEAYSFVDSESWLNRAGLSCR